MLGSVLGSNRATDAVVGLPAAPAPNPVAAGGRPHYGALTSDDGRAAAWTPWVLISFVLLWVLWAVVERHQKVRSQIQPKNIAVNLRNLAAIILPVIIGLALLRVALVKFKLWSAAIPGTVGDVIQGVLGALVRLVG